MKIDLSTKEGMDAMLAMHDAGDTYAQIAPRCHVAGRPINVPTLRDRVFKYRTLGKIPTMRKIGITKQELAKMADRGLTPQDVAKALGRDCGVIVWWEKRLGVRLPRRRIVEKDPVLKDTDLPASYFLPNDLKLIINSRWAA